MPAAPAVREMVTDGGLSGGWRKSEWLETYADYCLKFVSAYRDAGVNVQAFTVQNEPECQRGGSPTAKDRMMASLMGAYAVDLLCEGKSNRVVASQGGCLVDYDIDEALAMTKTIDEYEFQICNNLSK